VVDDAGEVGHELVGAGAAGGRVGAGTADGEDGGQAHEVLGRLSLYGGFRSADCQSARRMPSCPTLSDECYTLSKGLKLCKRPTPSGTPMN